MFATFALEKDPLGVADLALLTWVQWAGGFCAVFVLLWLVFGLAGRRRLGLLGESAEERPIQARLFWLGVMVTAAAYALFVIIRAPEVLEWLKSYAVPETAGAAATPLLGERYQTLCLMVGGAAAMFSVLLQPLTELSRLHFRRIWAIARVTIKEAVRRRILWVFLFILLVFLFASWFIEYKPEDQVRVYVTVVYFAMTLLLLTTAGLLAAFGLPADIKSQTIHTIITKPVERVEILLGRFVGYSLLMSVVLLVMTGVSYLYMTREIHPLAQEESFKARVPIYGDLAFFKGNEPGKERQDKAENVGREWDYRGYVGGKAAETQYAVWALHDVPSHNESKPMISCEFAFDIYRTTKGERVDCTFTFRAWHWQAPDAENPSATGALRMQLYEDERGYESSPDKEWNDFVASVLAVKYGLHRVASKPIDDYHTFGIEVPATIFREPRDVLADFQKQANAAPEDYRARADQYRQARDARERKVLRDQLHQMEQTLDTKERHQGAFLYRELPAIERKVQTLESMGKTNQTPVEVWVNCETPSQFVGMAKYDLYLLDSEQPFVLNFFKGIFGLWCLIELLVALCLAASTYLSGVIAWIAALVVFLLGGAQDFIQTVANGTSQGGGPAEAFIRLVNRQVPAATLEESAPVRVALSSDEAFRFFLRSLMHGLPDISRYSFTDYVANGFNVPGMQLFYSFLLLVEYLLPWALLAYYLFKWREVASST